MADFNPLPSCEGRPRTTRKGSCFWTNFNPLPSCEGRRRILMSSLNMQTFQSTPLMRGETLCTIGTIGMYRHISIHSPHARGDLARGTIANMIGDFNPLPSCEGRPVQWAVQEPTVFISIHSPHARGDIRPRIAHNIIINFNPLPSCEGRRWTLPVNCKRLANFNPLPSCEGRL